LGVINPKKNAHDTGLNKREMDIGAIVIDPSYCKAKHTVTAGDSDDYDVYEMVPAPYVASGFENGADPALDYVKNNDKVSFSINSKK